MTLAAVSVCVPLRNEQEALPSLLTALAGLDLPPARLAVFCLLDNCTDDSERVLRGAATDFPHPMTIASGTPSADANAGRARRAAMALGLDHARSGSGGILLSTDADSQPRADWVRAAFHGLALADVVAGRVIRSAADRDLDQSRVEAYFDRLHALRRTIDPVPWDTPAGSHHSGGANLGFRVDAYDRLGGFRPLRSGEDAAFIDDASRAGMRVRREPAMVVETSSRRDGRAPGGLAAALREIDGHGLPGIPHPAAAVWQYRLQADARRVFGMIDDRRAVAGFGEMIGLSADHVIGVARDCPNAEAFAMRIVPAAPFANPVIAFVDAELALAALERTAFVEAA
ncbi:glycosyltransferase [Sphingomonas sp. Tas61C01]|uniref:glycosyltransferase n=1 Tax=Sphingomonas sp. Tas61C01 TaxID=3458297 RepID=UPI00403EB2CA